MTKRNRWNDRVNGFLVAVAFIEVMSVASWAAVPRGIVLIPQGTVQVRSGTSNTWNTVTRPIKLDAGQEVKTISGSSAQIIFSDGSKVELSANAIFAVERTDTKEANFNLKLGKLKAYFSGIFSGRMNVRTPTAVAAVRGTEFEISAGQNGNTEMSVNEGHVEVQDNHGHQAVVAAEETLQVNSSGMQEPRLVPLSDPHAQPAARPMEVRMEAAREKTRTMIEELRNRELKANEAQLGKDSIDAFGNRVRIEEYILRPANNELKFLFLSFRENRFDWGSLTERFASAIPNDFSQLPAIISGGFFSSTAPKNWLKYLEVYLTNTTDAIQETITYGDPVAMDFSGYGAAVGTRYYPSSIDYKQILSGPGVPGGQKTIFNLTQSWTSGRFFVTQKVIDNTSTLNTLVAVTLNPASTAEVAAGGVLLVNNTANPSIAPVTTASYPHGPGMADYLVTTRYADGTTVGSEKFLVSNDGDILDFTNPNANTFSKPGSYNVEQVVTSSLFGGRKIDVMIAPEIFRQKQENAKTIDQRDPLD